MQTNLEQVTNIIKTLPIEDLNKLSEAINKERQQKQRKLTDNGDAIRKRVERFKKAEKWLAENSEKYMNKWVCLEGDHLIAADDDGRTVYQKAKEVGIEIPFIHHIVEEPKFYAGNGFERIRN